MKERKPYFRASCRAWYILWEGRQEWLGRDRQEATDNLARLKAGKPVDRPTGRKAARPGEPSIREIVDAFLTFVQKKRKPGTYRWYRQYLKSFCQHAGDATKMSLVSKKLLSEWIDAKGWDSKPNSAFSANRTVVACLNWAVEEKMLAETPIGLFVEAPDPRDCYITPEEWTKVVEAVTDVGFRDAIVFMRLTGARPMECRNAEKRHFDPKVPAIVFPPDETKRSRGKKTERVIHLAGEALEIVQRRCEQYPEGAIFRNGRGTPWKKDGLTHRFARLSEKLKMPHLIPYALRHTFATDALIAGLNTLTVAELMGHKGTKMLEAIYQKIRKRQDYMKAAAAKAVEGVK